MSFTITKKNLLVLAVVPFLFACSKSKFSAVKATPPTQEVPAPVVPPLTVDPIDPPDRPCGGNPCHPTPPPVIVTPPPCHSCEPEPPPCNGGCKPTPPPPVVVVPPPVRPTPPQCEEFEYDQPEYHSGIKGVNIWIFADGSKSSRDERAAYARSVVSSVDSRLLRHVPVTVSMVAAHSRKSVYSAAYNGPERDSNRDFFFKSDAGEAAVIKFRPNMDANERKAAEEALFAKIMGMKTDNSAGWSDGGELLVYNMLAAFKEERQAWAKEVGALKKDYLLQILFMTDENDICTPGKLASSLTPKGVETEIQSYADHCFGIDTNHSGVAYNRANSSYSDANYSMTAFNKIESLKRTRKVMLGSFAYASKDGANIPQDEIGQNEFANGIIQLVKAQRGLSIDLGNLKNMTDVNGAANQWTDFTNSAFSNDLYVTFPMERNGQPLGATDYDYANAQVTVAGKVIATAPGNGNFLVARERCDVGRVKIKICKRR